MILHSRKIAVVVTLCLGIQSYLLFGMKFQTFDSVFNKDKEIILQTKDLEIGVFRELHIDSNNNLIFLDPKGCQILLFNQDGRFIKKIGNRGEGPGEYLLPIAVTVANNPERDIVVSDAQLRRINRYNKDGEFIFSFIINSNHWPPKALRVDSHGNYFLSGLTLAEQGQGDWINKYNSEGKYIKSFFKRNTKQRWLGSMFPAFSFDLDPDDAIFAIQINKYEISSFNSEGNLVNKMTQTPNYFIEPNPHLKINYSKYKNISDLRKKMEELSQSWTRILHIKAITRKYLLLFLEANNFIKKSKKKYILDILDKKGTFLKVGIQTDYKFLTSDDKGYCYFLIFTDEEQALEKNPEYRIGKYKLNIK